jgi:hypothetical protein
MTPMVSQRKSNERSVVNGEGPLCARPIIRRRGEGLLTFRCTAAFFGLAAVRDLVPALAICLFLEHRLSG